VLGGGKSSRLYKKLVYEKQIAQDVLVYLQSLRLGSVLELQCTAKPGVKLADLEKAIDEEFARVRADGPTQSELERARNTVQTRLITGIEGYGGLADRINLYNQYLQDPDYLPKDLDRYTRVTTASMRKTAQQYLTINARIVVEGLPGKKVIDDPPRTKAEEEQESKEHVAVAGTMPDEPWRAKAPSPGPASRLTLPAPVSFKLANGLTVMLVEQHQLPIVSTRLVALAGGDNNPVDLPGLASFTADMLTEGTEHRSTLQLADDAAQIGVSLEAQAITDYASISTRTLTPNSAAALDLLSDVVLHPKFDPAELERVRKERQTDILQIQDDPIQLALGVLRKTVFGPSHPYGYRDEGTEASNKAITRDEILSFWKRTYLPGNSALILAGDLNPDQAHSLAEKYFAEWRGNTPRHMPPPVKNTTTRGIYLVDKPGSPQTLLVVGGTAAPRSTPDYVPLEVMNNVLGGLFSSRINMNLREEHGYTYGGFSFFIYRRGPGLFLAGGGIRTDATAPALHELYKELDRIRSAPPSPEELTLAKGAFSLSLAGLFENGGQTARTISDLFVYNLPLDYYQKLPAQSDAVTAADVQRVAEKYIHPDQFVAVGAGDYAKVGPALRKLDLGPVALRDADGNPAKTETAAGQSH